MTRVGIVGAGITGLSLTHYLADTPVEPITFEAAPEAGGVIKSRKTDGRVLEYGPQRCRLTPELDELITAIDLDDAVIAADQDLPLYVYADGALRTVPFSVRDFLSTDALSWRGKARVLIEPFTAPGRAGETAAEFFKRKFGREAYHRLIGPLFGGIYGSDPERMPAKHALGPLFRVEEREGSLLRAALKRVRDGQQPPAITFRDGLQQLPAALADRHADRLHCQTPVQTIRQDDDQYILATEDGDTHVDAVVITAPAEAAASMLGELIDSAGYLDALHYNPLAMVYLDAPIDREGYGYQIQPGQGFSTLGVTWNSSLFDRDGVYTCFLGGMYEPQLIERADDELGRVASDEFREIMGVEASVLDVWRLPKAFPAYDESWTNLDHLHLPPDLYLATNYTGRLGIPGRIQEAKQLSSTFVNEHA